MTTDTDITLSGPFTARDAAGRDHAVKAIRIFDEGYGAIDVFVDFAAAIDTSLRQDKTLIASISAHLHTLGYVGPALTPGDPVLQEKRMIVLEAPDEFCAFAKRKGWKDLAEEYGED